MLEAMTVRVTTIHGERVDMDFAPYEETDDPNVKAHFIRGQENPDLWKDGMVAQDVVDLARFLEAELTALCGYKWVPKHHPDKHEICEPCMKIWESLA